MWTINIHLSPDRRCDKADTEIQSGRDNETPEWRLICNSRRGGWGAKKRPTFLIKKKNIAIFCIIMYRIIQFYLSEGRK
jgi:hypothetical protein